MESQTIHEDLWGVHAEDWAFKAEPTTEPLWRAVLEATRVGPGTALLDIGCGGGGLCVLAERLGATVSGLDASESLIGIARRRVPGGSFQAGDLGSLPYENSAFDSVIACNSIQFANDQLRAVKEASRVKKPDGLLAVGMWCEPERCEMSAIFRAVGAIAPPPPSENQPPSLASRDNLVGLVQSAGLSVRNKGEVECVFEFSDMENAWLAVRSPGLMVSVARAVGDERLRATVVGALEPFRRPNGKVTLSNWFRYVVCS